MKRKIQLYSIDILCFAIAYLLSFALEGLRYPIAEWYQYFIHGGILIVLITLARFAFRIYSNVWRYVTVDVYLKIMCADVLGGVVGILLSALIGLKVSVLQGICCVGAFLLGTLLNRMAYRQINGRFKSSDKATKINVAIVGAGKVGVLLAQELRVSKKSHYHPYCFLDTNPDKAGNYIDGIRIYHEDQDSIELIKSLPIQEIFIAIPRLKGEELQRMYDYYSQTGCKIKIYDLPISKLNQDTPEESGHRTLREFKIEDLLFRHSLEINNEKSRNFYGGKTILVTGGGGSIGSELCRQLVTCKPKRLIIVDIYENNAYDIQQELKREYGDDLDLCVEIASVRDRKRLECIFDHYRPEVVFHAAAHKHVPLMEHSNCEAIKNNVFGTYNTADMAEKFGAERFILISTDKAVNPTNIMGASKRMCEMVVQCRTDGPTSFVAVRFGNVLGSNGSVIPLFKRQIENGGPITLTDKRIIRYFMTIPEASQLVMQAGAMAKRGELFVLDMGRPVKILELAENMIRLSGLEPYRDIDIREVGLRPGEKLYEELLIANERMTKTSNKMIFIEHDTPLTREEVEEKLTLLRDAVQESENELESEKIRLAMKQAVPTFRDPEEINSCQETLKKQGCTETGVVS